MLSDDQQEKASLYVLGVLSEAQISEFEVELSANPSLSALTGSLSDAATDFARAVVPRAKPPARLRDRVLAIAEANLGSPEFSRTLGLREEALVVTDREGLIVWVNDAFIEMCGYSIAELRGKRPGRLLQGPATDPEMSRHLGTVFATGEFCTGNIVNYHKNGEPYWVSIAVNAVLDGNQSPLAFIAVERKLGDPVSTPV